MLKKFIAILMVFVFVGFLGLSAAAQTTLEEYKKVSDYLALVDKKLANRRRAGNTKAVATLKKEKAKTIERLKELKKKLEEEKETQDAAREAARKAVMEAMASPEVVVEVEEVVVAEVAPKGRFSNFRPQLGPFKLGGVVGLNAGMPGATLQFWFPIPIRVADINMEGRWSLGYAQGEDANGFLRKCIPVDIGGVVFLPTDWTSGAQSYLGGSVNYLALTSGMTSGSYGGSLFYGLESDSWIGKLFVELGYGAIRTGFSPSLKGGHITLGFRYFEN